MDKYLACEEMNFWWTKENVLKFDRLWREGLPIWEIAEKLNRDVDEVALLIIDRARRKRIEKRENGVYGRN